MNWVFLTSLAVMAYMWGAFWLWGWLHIPVSAWYFAPTVGTLIGIGAGLISLMVMTLIEFVGQSDDGEGEP